MFKRLLQRLGLISLSQKDEHIEFMGDNVSLQRKNYPIVLTDVEEYEMYSNLSWDDTICFLKGDVTKFKYEVTVQEAIQLIQNGYMPIPLRR